MTTKATPLRSYSSTHSNDEQIFSDEQIQRYDADTIKHRYGENWRNYASNVREIKQADGSIVREYIIDDPSLLKEIQPSVDSTSSTTDSDDDRQPARNKFAQIKAKFEQRTSSNVMASPASSSSATSSNTTANTTPHRHLNRRTDDQFEKTRRGSNDFLPMNQTNVNVPKQTQIPYSQPTSASSFRRLTSADDADEEVQRIHRQSHDFQQFSQKSTPVTSTDVHRDQSNIQYEVLDEDGNPMAIDDVDELIKMSGVTAREVPQPDGTIVREYVIDDPSLLSQFRPQQSPILSQSRTPRQEHIPPPPPRIPLKQTPLFRPGPVTADKVAPPVNIQQIRVLEPQRRYEFITTSGKRIEFIITKQDSDNQQVTDSDIRELSSAINTRLIPPSSTSNNTQQPFTLPKQWHPSVDLTHREGVNRQRTGSDNQPPANAYNPTFQHAPPTQSDLARSASYGAINQGPYQQQFDPVFTEPIIDWSALRQQDPHGQIDPQLVRQFITQKHQAGSFQSSAQFLPEQQQQQQRPINSPQAANPTAVFYQQPTAYPYQGQQQHGVRIMTNTNDLSSQQHATMIGNGLTRI